MKKAVKSAIDLCKYARQRHINYLQNLSSRERNIVAVVKIVSIVLLFVSLFLMVYVYLYL